jgi:putative phage-type endonuclease
MSKKVKLIDVEQRSEAWHQARLGRVTGTVLKKLLGTPKVRETMFYEILAERLSIEANSEESAMDRGVRLENEALEAYKMATGAKICVIGFVEHKDNKWIGYSPDAIVEPLESYTKDVEVKCLSSCNHLRAFLTQKIPEDYIAQGIHAFVVNDDLQERDFVFYDPRITVKPFFIITMKRADYEKDIDEAKKKVEEFLLEINSAIDKII